MRLRVEVAAGRDRRDVRVHTSTAGVNISDRVPAHRTAGLPTPSDEQVAALAVEIAECQATAATLRQGADRTHRIEAAPQAMFVDPHPLSPSVGRRWHIRSPAALGRRSIDPQVIAQDDAVRAFSLLARHQPVQRVGSDAVRVAGAGGPYPPPVPPTTAIRSPRATGIALSIEGNSTRSPPARVSSVLASAPSQPPSIPGRVCAWPSPSTAMKPADSSSTSLMELQPPRH